jgi:hypothetical protein
MMVLLPARTEMDGCIFMPIKDSPFPVQSAERMTFRAQSAIIMKSQYQNQLVLIGE